MKDIERLTGIELDAACWNEICDVFDKHYCNGHLLNYSLLVCSSHRGNSSEVLVETVVNELRENRKKIEELEAEIERLKNGEVQES